MKHKPTRTSFYMNLHILKPIHKIILRPTFLCKVIFWNALLHCFHLNSQNQNTNSKNLKKSPYDLKYKYSYYNLNKAILPKLKALHTLNLYLEELYPR